MIDLRRLQLSIYRAIDGIFPHIYARYSRSPLYGHKWRRRLARAALDLEQAPWSPLSRPLAQATVALVTTGGVHLKTQPPHSAVGDDPSFRKIPADAATADLRVFHPAVNNADGNRDPNILLPLDRLRELAAQGVIGRVAPTHYSFVGLLKDFDALLGDTAPTMAAGLVAEGVDLAILTPS